MRRPARWMTTAAMLAALPLLATCGGDDDSSSKPQDHVEKPTTSKDAPTTTTTAPADPEAQAKAVYTAGLNYFSKVAAMNPPNPEDQGLAKYFTGAALRKMIGNLLYFRQHGTFVRGHVPASPKTASTTATDVLFRDCFVVKFVTYDSRTGKQVSPGSEDTNWRVRVVNTRDGWRVSELTDEKQPCG